jgi:hypothetical protein
MTTHLTATHPAAARTGSSLLGRVVVVLLATSMFTTLLPALESSAEQPPPETVQEEFDGFVAGGEPSTAGWQVSDVVEAPIAFTMLGFEVPETALLEVRTTADGETWSEWFEAETMVSDSAPDGEEAAAAEDPGDGRSFTEPIWTGEARWLQLRVAGATVEQIRATVIDSDGVSRSLLQRVRDSFRPSVGAAPAEASAPVRVISRTEWGADESWRTWNPRYHDDVRYAIVHHTAGGNSYTAAESAAVVRGIYSYHARTLGWGDIGYHVLVDRYGQVFEGRFGGLSRGVVAAHARGFNTGSFGISIMGNFQSVLPPAAAQEAVAQMIAWKFSVHGVQPKTTITVTSGGSDRYPTGTSVRLNTIAGHRDTGYTSCPGDQYYGRLGWLRDRVASLYTSPPERHTFPDISASNFADRPVSWLSANGITDGHGDTGLFRPDFAVTRGQMVAFLWRLAGEPTGYPPHGFPDVSNGAFYGPAVRWAKAEGITDGFGDTGRFEPHREVTRAQLAAFLHRLAGEPAANGRHRFSDVTRGSFADTAVSWMASHGITDGLGGTGRFGPANTANRGQMAAFLYRFAATPSATQGQSPGFKLVGR